MAETKHSPDCHGYCGWTGPWCDTRAQQVMGELRDERGEV